ncbi:unnamed protein product [Lactuca saligna]|uniref:1,3-beta-glucan synthase component FKS1-like domain-containing protein n=1 Tax=Lactuca saligna TaxID=75948 RepID=A0AA35YXD0_LACSI|nr:unnamed protein product [Lactuca saligna]
MSLYIFTQNTRPTSRPPFILFPFSLETLITRPSLLAFILDDHQSLLLGSSPPPYLPSLILSLCFSFFLDGSTAPASLWYHSSASLSPPRSRIKSNDGGRVKATNRDLLLHPRIKFKLAKKDGGRIDRNRDAQNTWDFYQHYKRVHRVDEIQIDEQRMLESGTFSYDMGGLIRTAYMNFSLGLRSQETKKVFTTLRALVEVMEIVSKDVAHAGVGKYIIEEASPIFIADYQIDISVKSFNVIDTHSCIQAINKDRKLFLVSLYYLIWGEAANVGFLPECICYRFHHMDREFNAILDHGQASPAQSFICEDNSVSLLANVIQPIYNTLSKEAERNNNGKLAHSTWRNYDDFNEYFWSPTFIFVVYDMNYLEIARYAFLFVLCGIFMAESVSDGEGNPMQKPNKRNNMKSDSRQKEKEDDGQQLGRSHKYFTTSGVAARTFQIDNEVGQLYKELLVAQEEAHLAHQQLTSSMVKLVEERKMKPLDSNLAALSARCSKDLELNLAKLILE